MIDNDVPRCATCRKANDRDSPDGLLWCREGVTAPRWMARDSGYREEAPEHVVPDFGCIFHSDLQDDD